MTDIPVRALTKVVDVREIGQTGKSAYEDWLNAGNVGTLEDFFSYKYQDSTDYSLIFLTTLL
jgi:hypothetical protein